MHNLTKEENKAVFAIISRPDIKRRLKAINGPAWLKADRLGTGNNEVWKAACKAYANGERDIDIIVAMIEAAVKLEPTD